MKIYIGPYANFWTTRYAEDRWFVFRYGKDGYDYPESKYSQLDKIVVGFLNLWQLIVCRPVNWIKDCFERKMKIKIHNYDTWNMDCTLAFIILPMLKQLRATKHGAPNTDNEDVPKYLRATAAERKNMNKTGDCDDKFFARWNWILDEMIWTFEQIVDENSDRKFYSGKMDWEFVPTENPDFKEIVKTPKSTFKVDREGLKKHHDRISNGTRLFGKYYQTLWD